MHRQPLFRGWIIRCVMTIFSLFSEFKNGCSVSWAIPLFLLSPLLTRLFAQKHTFLAICFCWHPVWTMNNGDEVQENARQRWLVDGDRNSRYFHLSAKARKQHSAIIRIKDDAGVWLDQLPLIQSKIINDFSARFSSGRPSHAINLSNLAQSGITAQENIDLTRPVTDNEIYQALFDMDPHKAPRPDGFGASFIKIIGSK